MTGIIGETGSSSGEVGTTSKVAMAEEDVRGGLIGFQSFTSTGTYTKTSGTNSILVICTGGGGGGGGRGFGNDVGSGGGGGGTAIKRITGGVTGITCTIGPVGARGNITEDGGTGGTCSFGNHISAAGGNGGYEGNAGSVKGGWGGGGSSGDINIHGGSGMGGMDDPGSTHFSGGNGGATYWGGGRVGSHHNFNPGPVPGSYIASYGGGGGGGYAATGENGGEGKQGIIAIWEYS